MDVKPHGHFSQTFLCLPSHYQSLDQFPYFSVKFHLYWYWHPLQLRNGSNKWNDNLPISRQNNPTLLFMYCTVYYDKTVSHSLNDTSCNAGSTKWELHFCLTRYSWSLNTDQYCKRRVHTHTHTHTQTEGLQSAASSCVSALMECDALAWFRAFSWISLAHEQTDYVIITAVVFVIWEPCCVELFMRYKVISAHTETRTTSMSEQGLQW